MFGRRSDGKLVRGLDPIVALTPYLMPMRCDAQVMLDYRVDYERLARYIVKKGREGVKITFTDLLIASYVRMISQVPELNRFIANKRTYARTELTCSFVVLQNTRDGSVAENTTKCKFDPHDTIYDVSARVSKAIEESRKEDADNSTMKIARMLTNPYLATFIAAVARLLDRYGLSRVLYPAYAVAGLSMLLLAASRTLPPVLVASMLRSLGQSAAQPALQATCIRKLGPARTGVATSTFFVGADVGQGLGPIIGGAVSETMGYSAMYAGTGVVLMLGMVLYAWYERRQRARQSEAPAS